MSYRERRNRKDSKGKTPVQVRREYERHYASYGDAIGTHCALEPDVISSAGYMRGIELHFTHWPNTGDERAWDIPE